MSSLHIATVWAVLWSAGIKSFLILAATLAATCALRRSSAALRHLLWVLAIVAALALPVLSPVMPVWHVAIPRSAPAHVAWIVTAYHVADTEAPAAQTNQVPQTPPGRSVAGAASASAAAQPLGGVDWRRIAVLIWAGGTLVLLARLALAAAVLRRVGRRATPDHSLVWKTRLAELSAEIGLRRSVALLRSGRHAMPMTFGIVWPKVILPAACDDWTPVHNRTALLHELVHVRRCDCLWQLIGQIALAAYWFNPLAWVALNRLTVERERACDDIVLGRGAAASTYAEQLLAVATGFRGPRIGAGAAVAMARPGKLEGRLLAILDPARRRGSTTVRQTIAVTAMLAIVVVPLAACHTSAQNTAPSSASNQPTTEPASGGNTGLGGSGSAAPDAPSFAPGMPLGSAAAAPRFAPPAAQALPPMAPVEPAPAAQPVLPMLPGALITSADGNPPVAASGNTLFFTGPDGQQREEVTKQLAEAQDQMRIAADDYRQQMLTFGGAGDFGNDPNRPFIIMRRADDIVLPADKSTVATLHDNIAVELMGVCNGPSDAGHWWQPDGSPLASAPMDAAGLPKIVDKPDTRMVYRSMLIHVNRPASEPVAVKWDFGRSTDFVASQSEGQDDQMLCAVTARVWAKWHTANVRVGVAAGEWKTRAKCDTTRGGSLEGTDQVILSPAIESGGDTFVVVTHNLGEDQTRLVAIDAAGNEHVGDPSTGAGNGRVTQDSIKFAHLAMSDIRTLQFQARPYQWILFTNIALAPTAQGAQPPGPAAERAARELGR